jgi:hypothetical protein
MITEREQVTKKYWDADVCAYVYRMPNAADGTEIHRYIWWCTPAGERPTWVLQLIDSNGDQIGNARYAANKRCLQDTLEYGFTQPDY